MSCGPQLSALCVGQEYGEGIPSCTPDLVLSVGVLGVEPLCPSLQRTWNRVAGLTADSRSPPYMHQFLIKNVQVPSICHVTISCCLWYRANEMQEVWACSPVGHPLLRCGPCLREAPRSVLGRKGPRCPHSWPSDPYYEPSGLQKPHHCAGNSHPP